MKAEKILVILITQRMRNFSCFLNSYAFRYKQGKADDLHHRYESSWLN